MKFVASNVRVPLDAMLPGADKALRRAVARAVGLKAAQLSDLRIRRRSVDARKKSDVHFVLTCTFALRGGDEDGGGAAQASCRRGGGGALWPSKAARGVRVEPYEPPDPVCIPDLADAFEQSGRPRPVVVGAGPAGLFCALWLARAGLRPLVIERGQMVEDRACTVAAFDAGAPLDPHSNIQFGEGGAGAFSDGKLTCGRTDPHIRHVLEEFVAAGAPEDILIDAKPHIGTDYLPRTVRGLREAICRAGGEFRFNTLMEELVVESCGEGDHEDAPRLRSDAAVAASRSDGRGKEQDATLGTSSSDVRPLDAAATGRVCGAVLRDLYTGDRRVVATDTVVLAIGHSARDTYRMLLDAGAAMEGKPFAVGVRIEHPQALVDRAQYGRIAGHPALPPAEYKLNVRTAADRGVYTFCMCPGGTVVAAASEDGGVCTNGMSTHARDGANANSALLVEVRPEDLPGTDVLAGVRFQQGLEREAYALGSRVSAFVAPAQTVGDFLGGGPHGAAPADGAPPDFGAEGTVDPTYPRGVAWTDLHACLPPFISEALTEALPLLDAKLHGFADEHAVLTAVEARSSSPVRILRDRAARESISIGGLYPAGEGAGYAGGIMSAATDGIRTAEAVMRRFALQQVARDLAGTVDHLLAGGSAIIPTDTVAGAAVCPQACASPAALFDLKRRDGAKPVAWLVFGPDALDDLAPDAPTYARKLAERFWPGAVTLVVKAGPAIPDAFAAADGTIGLRMPACAEVLDLLHCIGPLAVTSANLSGYPAPAEVSQVDPQLLLQSGCAFIPQSSYAPAEQHVSRETCVPITLVKNNPEQGKHNILYESNVSRETFVPIDSDKSNSELVKREPKGEGSVSRGTIPSEAYPSGTASVVVDCTGPAPRVLRDGAVPAEEIYDAVR